MPETLILVTSARGPCLGFLGSGGIPAQLWGHMRVSGGLVSLARVEGGRELGSTAAHMLLQASLERPGAVNVYYYKQFLKKRFYF